jgi:EmrB/QacA subfamily drug resistance transporter
MLNLARGAQGVGGAIMFATSLALIAAAFQGKERGTAFGIYGAVIGGAVAVGPLIGGALTSGLGWRWIFFVNVPVGALAILITLTRVHQSQEINQRRIDWIGFVTFSVALFMLVFALVRGNSKGWGSTVILSLLIGSAVLLGIFLVAEWRQSDPMLDLNLFRRPAVVGASIVAFTLSASIFALFLYITLYVQDDLGYGPFAAGVRFLPITVTSFLAAPIAGKLSVRIKSRYLLGTGLLLVAVGLFLMSYVHASSGWTVLLPGFIITGIGIGTVNPVLASAAISVVPPERSGMASGANNTFRQVGIATGIAGLGAVFQSQIVSKTVAELGASSTGRAVLVRGGAGLKGAITGGGVREVSAAIPFAPARAALLDAYQVAFASTFDHLMLIGVVVAAFGSISAFALVRQRDFVPSYSPGERADSGVEQPAVVVP